MIPTLLCRRGGPRLHAGSRRGRRFRDKAGIVALAVALLGAFACTDSGDVGALEAAPAAPEEGIPSPSATTAWVIFGADTVVAELARTEAERNRGLMYRESLPENGGMLFMFPDNSVRSFWMQNTYIALDIAFMAPDFRIFDIQQMEPMTTTSHTSRGPANYALEVNQGWFEAHGVRVGDIPQVVFGN